jgi:hypothetical protein
VARALPTPVLEVAPGEAVLLREVFALEPAALERSVARAEEPLRPAAARRRGSDPEPILTIAVADALAAGALHLAANGGGITLWAKGLRVGDFSLPVPLESLSGRLWLTDAGIRKGFAAIQKVALAHGRALVATAADRLVLVPPTSERRRALERFLAHCRAVVEAGKDAAGIAPILRHDDPAPAATGALASARLPGLVRVWMPLLLRHALGRPVETDTAWLQWKAAKLRDKKGLLSIELGSRHDWIARALGDAARPRDAYAAAALVVAEVAEQASMPADEVALALARILATSFAGPRQ